MRTRRVIVLAALVALGVAAVAQATKYRFDTADQATAASSLLKLGDLPKPYTWKGSAVTSGAPAAASAGFSCKSFTPKTSDLVVTGAAASSFTAKEIQVLDHAIVMKSPQMVKAVFQRTYVARFVPCLEASLTSGVKGLTIVKGGSVKFAKEAAYNAAYRVIFTIRANGTSEEGVLDFVALGAGRKQVTFTLTALLGPNVTAKALQGSTYGMAVIDLSLASKLARRALGA